ncbi:MAG: aldo/keto reductase [Pseudomonadota bacterium]
MTKTTINVGQSTMPAVGFGLWKIEPAATAPMVEAAISAGYRHLDCACDYGNEVETGNGIKAAISKGEVTRDDLWVTSKLWNTYHRAEHVEPALRRTLTDLQLDYLDLYLIHFPIAQPYVPFETRYPPEWFFDPDAADPRMEIDRVPLHETWQAMEKLVEKGLVREIGVCNYSSALVHDLMTYADVAPAMLQVESHPYLTQAPLLRVAENYGIAVTAFSPLGAGSYVSLGMAEQTDSVLETDVVKIIAARLGQTPAQVVLRWGVQRGTAVIPKTARPERLSENIAIFDFELTGNDMDAIAALNINRRFNDPKVFTEAAFNRFHPIYD